MLYQEFDFNSPCCCPNKCINSPNVDGGGLSYGSLILIGFFSVIASYFILGMIFRKYKQKKTGSDIIPNKDFWKSLSSHTKVFIFKNCFYI